MDPRSPCRTASPHPPISWCDSTGDYLKYGHNGREPRITRITRIGGGIGLVVLRGEVGLFGWFGEVFQSGVKGVAQGVGILDFSRLQLLQHRLIGGGIALTFFGPPELHL